MAKAVSLEVTNHFAWDWKKLKSAPERISYPA
jgi:hypothetical protein